MEIIKKDELQIHYEIKYKKIKNTYFRINNQKLVVTTNKYTSKKVISNYILNKFDVFYERLTKDGQTEPDDQITLWNKKYYLKIFEGKFNYFILDQEIIAYSKSKDLKKIKKEIYKVEIKKKLNEVLDSIYITIKKQGLNPLPIKLKYLKSKFGSYHRKNKEITLNTFLARLDSIYLVYVIYHEYAHALVFNHSKDFYNLLSIWMPNHKAYQKDLKKIAII
jgi:predicted metal-dependent hydrolase